MCNYGHLLLATIASNDKVNFNNEASPNDKVNFKKDAMPNYGAQWKSEAGSHAKDNSNNATNSNDEASPI